MQNVERSRFFRCSVVVGCDLYHAHLSIAREHLDTINLFLADLNRFGGQHLAAGVALHLFDRLLQGHFGMHRSRRQTQGETGQKK